MLKWQRLQMLVTMSCALSSEESLYQALMARFSTLKRPVIVVDSKRRRWEIYDIPTAQGMFI